MREISFRAWDKRHNEMVIIDDLYWFEEQGVHSSSEANTTTGDYILMHYTGLHDRNGKEVAEADILREPDGRIYFIVWSEYEARFELMNAQDHTLRHIPDVKIMTIIGNKFENGDLL